MTFPCVRLITFGSCLQLLQPRRAGDGLPFDAWMALMQRGNDLFRTGSASFEEWTKAQKLVRDSVIGSARRSDNLADMFVLPSPGGAGLAKRSAPFARFRFLYARRRRRTTISQRTGQKGKLWHCE